MTIQQNILNQPAKRRIKNPYCKIYLLSCLKYIQEESENNCNLRPGSMK